MCFFNCFVDFVRIQLAGAYRLLNDARHASINSQIATDISPLEGISVSISHFVVHILEIDTEGNQNMFTVQLQQK